MLVRPTKKVTAPSLRPKAKKRKRMLAQADLDEAARRASEILERIRKRRAEEAGETADPNAPVEEKKKKKKKDKSTVGIREYFRRIEEATKE